jgi:hypothetical protein
MANGGLCATACKDMAVIQKETYKQIDEEQLNKKIRFCISWFFLFSFSSKKIRRLQWRIGGLQESFWIEGSSIFSKFDNKDGDDDRHHQYVGSG